MGFYNPNRDKAVRELSCMVIFSHFLMYVDTMSKSLFIEVTINVWAIVQKHLSTSVASYTSLKAKK